MNPAGRKRLSRLVSMVALFHAGMPCDTVQLAAHFGISRRTVFRDLELLKEAGLQVAFSETAGHYELVGVPATSRSIQLTADEAMSIFLTFAQLPKRATITKPLLDALAKLLRQLRPEFRTEVTRVVRLCTDLRRRQPTGWSKTFDEILRAIREDKSVRVQYRTPYHPEPIVTRVVVKSFRSHEGTWTLFGRSSWHRKDSAIPLDQIEKTEVIAEETRTFKLPKKRRHRRGA